MADAFEARVYRRIQSVMLALTLLVGFAPFLQYLTLPGVLREAITVISTSDIDWFRYTVLLSNLGLMLLLTLTCWGGYFLIRRASGSRWKQVAADSLLLMGLQMILLWAQINVFHPK